MMRDLNPTHEALAKFIVMNDQYHQAAGTLLKNLCDAVGVDQSQGAKASMQRMRAISEDLIVLQECLKRIGGHCSEMVVNLASDASAVVN